MGAVGTCVCSPQRSNGMFSACSYMHALVCVRREVEVEVVVEVVVVVMLVRFDYMS